MNKFERLRMTVRAKIESLEKKVNELTNLLLVDNYFKDCPCCSGDDKLLKLDAESFEIKECRLVDIRLPSQTWIVTHYTTEESYKTHLPKIKEWGKEVKELRGEK